MGAPGAVSGIGKAYVFSRPQAGWPSSMNETAVLTADDEGGSLGDAIAISPDGISVVVGADSRMTNEGGIYLYVRSGNTWSAESETEILTTTDYLGNFGRSVAFAASTGDIFGGEDTSGTLNEGSVDIFLASNLADITTQSAQLFPSDGSDTGYTGQTIAMSSDGKIIAAGMPGFGADQQGAVLIFTEGPNGWSDATQSATLFASDGTTDDVLGWVVAMTPDGKTIVTSAVNRALRGVLYVFNEPAGGGPTKSRAPS